MMWRNKEADCGQLRLCACRYEGTFGGSFSSSPIESILPTQLNGPEAISRPIVSPDERTIIQGARAVTARFSHSEVGNRVRCAIRVDCEAGSGLAIAAEGVWCSDGDNGTRDLRVEKER